MPAAAPAVANQAHLVGLDRSDIDSAEIGRRHGRGRSRKSNRQGGSGESELEDIQGKPPLDFWSERLKALAKDKVPKKILRDRMRLRPHPAGMTIAVLA
jgi:hypothetical protein